MAIANPLARLVRMQARARRLIRRFHKGESGVAAVEFALMLPVMLSVWVGMVVATDAINANKKVTLLARTLADITTQSSIVSQVDMDTIFNASTQIMYPQAASALGMRVTALLIDGAGTPFVDWSVVPSNGALKGTFSPIAHCTQLTTLPAGLKVARTSIILAEVTMSYSASIVTDLANELFGATYSGNKMPLADNLYMRPRQSTKVAFNPAPTTCPGFVP